MNDEMTDRIAAFEETHKLLREAVDLIWQMVRRAHDLECEWDGFDGSRNDAAPRRDEDEDQL
jgi:hypothetical protein